MIKKIGAILLALVLSLSVVVLPVSALEVTGDNTLAFELKWDKEYYKAGDTAVLSVYMKGAEGIQIHSGALMIGFDSTQIVELANEDADTIKSNWIASDLYTSCWKGVGSAAITLFSETNATVGAKVESNSTSEEAATYNYYQKIVIARDTSTEIGGNSKAGVPTEDLNALADAGEPLLQFVYTIADGVADGTKIVAGIPSGSAVGTTHTQFKQMKSPGTATTTATIAPATFDLSAAVAEATVGTPSIISTLNPQIRFNGLETNGAGSANFDVRTRATVSKADFAAALGVSEAEFEATAKAKGSDLRVGFVYQSTDSGAFDIAKAEAAALAGEKEGGYEGGYYVKDVTYIQRSGNNYVWTCLLTYTDGMYDDGVTTYAYIICGNDVQIFAADKTSVTFSALYGTYYSQYAATQA